MIIDETEKVSGHMEAEKRPKWAELELPFRWYSRYKQTLWEVDCHIRGEADHSVSDSDRKGEEGGEP